MSARLIAAFVVGLIALAIWSIATDQPQTPRPGTLDIILEH